ncbi:MAG TPA: hypothetical protein VHH34_10575, partial [Pseudonocardiaceae bacterium]|nr:hypothetical protein [Pseudonocardiaceae bacterium]
PPGSSGPVQAPPAAEDPAEGPAAGSTTVALPGSLAVSTHTIDLGRDAISSHVELTNAGDPPLTWAATSNEAWLTVGPPGGVLAGHASVTLDVTADRSQVPEGKARGSLRVSWSGGVLPIDVTMTKERAPQIAAPRTTTPGCAQPNRPAGPIRVTVSASDDTGIRSVTLTWAQPDGSVSTVQLRPRGGGWVGAAGPFPNPGTVVLQATATDMAGNTSTGPATRIRVAPCPR